MSLQSAFTPSNQRIKRSFDTNHEHLIGELSSGASKPRGPPERQLTIMLVSVCVAFVCLRLPYTVSYAVNEYTKDPNAARSTAQDLPYVVATKITDVIATTNYMVNFFLYGLCGSYFRQQVRLIFPPAGASCIPLRSSRSRWAGGKTAPVRQRTFDPHELSDDAHKRQIGRRQSQHLQINEIAYS